MAPTSYESYLTGQDNNTSFNGTSWRGQTFTVGATGHTITSVKLLTHRHIPGTPGTLTITIRATDGSDLPTGGDLTSGTTEMDGWTGDATWHEITLTEITLTANIKYAIVADQTDADGSNYSTWWYDGSSPAYTGGSYVASYDEGVTWSATTARDFLFDIYGNALGGGAVTPTRMNLTYSMLTMRPLFYRRRLKQKMVI